MLTTDQFHEVAVPTFYTVVGAGKDVFFFTRSSKLTNESKTKMS